MTRLVTTALAFLSFGQVSDGPRIVQGPVVGHVSAFSVSIWARAASPGQFTLRATPAGTSDWVESTESAVRHNDMTMVLTLDGLEPDTGYDYAVTPWGQDPDPSELASFTTAPLNDAAVAVTLAFGSCAKENAGTARVWERIDASGVDAVVLLGDTPYIDTTDISTQRRRHREFLSFEPTARVLRHTPLYATWDDHDFGRNDTDGNLHGKGDARRAFVEYHANPSAGDSQRGIFTSFRRGPVEVFLLDTRYFAGTERSPADTTKPTLLGIRQWKWLRRGLMASDAPFKVLASGMVWNGAVRPNKTDHWAHYAHERDALFRFIGEQRITGVVLVGGDVHRSRVVRHATSGRVGYDLTELITSPMHGSVIATANAPHPGLVWDAGAPHTFLLLTVDGTTRPATLAARFMDADGTALHVERLVEQQR